MRAFTLQALIRLGETERAGRELAGLRNLNAKLGTHRRFEAVDRARELGLLAPLR